MPALPQLDWTKKLAENAAQRYSDLLAFSAQRLQAQAEFLQGLAQCSSPSDVFRHQSDFAQASWAAYTKELPKVFGDTSKQAS